MTVLKERLVDLATATARDLRLIHGRVDGDLLTAEKVNLAAAVNELATRVPVNIAVGVIPPTSPSLNDLWVDTNQMGEVHTIKGLIARDRLTVKDIVTEDANSRAVATEWFLEGELVRRDVAVSILSGQALFGEAKELA